MIYIFWSHSDRDEQGSFRVATDHGLVEDIVAVHAPESFPAGDPVEHVAAGLPGGQGRRCVAWVQRQGHLGRPGRLCVPLRLRQHENFGASRGCTYHLSVSRRVLNEATAVHVDAKLKIIVFLYEYIWSNRVGCFFCYVLLSYFITNLTKKSPELWRLEVYIYHSTESQNVADTSDVLVVTPLLKIGQFSCGQKFYSLLTRFCVKSNRVLNCIDIESKSNRKVFGHSESELNLNQKEFDTTVQYCLFTYERFHCNAFGLIGPSELDDRRLHAEERGESPQFHDEHHGHQRSRWHILHQPHDRQVFAVRH